MSRLANTAGWLIFAFLLSIGQCVEVHAQDAPGAGTIRILAVDAASRAPLAGVTIRLSRRDGDGFTRETVTGTDGVATFTALAAGDEYVVEVSLAGYARLRVDELTAAPGDVTERTVALLPVVTDAVRVRARGTPVELERTEQATKFEDVFIEGLPVRNRFFQNMLTFAPGVLDADDDGNPNVHGARTGDFRLLVNGLSNTDPLTGEWLSHVNLESIEELEIIAAGAGAKYGRAQGGFANLVQKQGSDELEGVAGMVWRTSRLDGDGGGGAGPAADFHWYQPYVQVSGPIVKGRLWYRASHEYVQREDPIDVLGSIAVTRREQTLNSDQLTWQVAPSHKLALHYLRDPLRLENVGVTSTVPPEASQTLERGGTTFALNWTAQPSPRLLFETTVAHQKQRFNTLPSRPGLDNECVFSVRFLALAGAQCFHTKTNLTSGSFPIQSRDVRRRSTLRGDAIFQAGRALGADHAIGFGWLVEEERYSRTLQRGLDVSFVPVNVPLSIFNPTGRLGFANTRFSVPETTLAKSTGTSWGVYLEDRMRFSTTVVMTLGVRLDREGIDSDGFEPFDPAAEQQAYLDLLEAGAPRTDAFRLAFTAYEDLVGFQRDARQALRSTVEVPLVSTANASAFWAKKRRPRNLTLRNTNVSPRFSLAWDPRGDGKTKLALSAGRYYDKIALSVPLVEQEPPVATLTFQSVPISTFGITARPVVRFNDPWQEIGLINSANPTSQVSFVDGDLRTPYQDEFALTFERELWNESSIKLAYVHRDYRDQLQDIETNHLPGDFGRCLRALRPGDPIITASPGTGPVFDPFTGELYDDIDPGNGDGRTDDCIGAARPVLRQTLSRNAPDGFADLYVQNPAWGDVLIVGNYNRAEYDGFVVEFVRRQFRGWQMNGSYTWSTARGDAETFDQSVGNDQALRLDAAGFLSYDQRHVVKINAATLTPWKFRFGAAVRWESGLPYSVVQTGLNAREIPLPYNNAGAGVDLVRLSFPTGERNDRRNASFWTFDLRFAKDVALGKQSALSLSAEIFNLLDDRTLRILERVDGENESVRRFGRQFQLGARLSF